MKTITEIIVDTLKSRPHGLTASGVCDLTGMASYNVSGKLSKLAAYGTIEAVRRKGQPMLYRWKPSALAPSSP